MFADTEMCAEARGHAWSCCVYKAKTEFYNSNELESLCFFNTI